MFSTSEIAEVTGGKLIGENVEVSGVSTDTRTIERGDLFIAIRGESFNGNDFVAAAAEKGAAAALCDGDVTADIPVIYTRDSRTAQLVLARYYRGKFPVKLCGVTGSVGKTSTKDMVYAVLSAKYNTLKTEGNFNNDIGLPRTLFRLNDSHGAAVIEMGMSARGEISQLSRAAHPDAAIITNIGYCHIENLKTRENILRAKLEILDGMSEGAPLIINGDDEYLGTLSGDRFGRRLIRYGLGADCDVMAGNIVHLPDGERFELIAEGMRYEAKLNVVGEHHIMNALAAFCAGREFGMEAEEIIPAFLNYKASGMRQRIERRGDITVILDCYNASPTSMRSALSVLGSIKSKRKIAVLGDMLELGDMSGQLHKMIADYIRLHADACFLYGREMTACRDALSGSGVEVFHSEDKEALTNRLNEYLAEGDAVLFKGSRGMKMEEIAEKVQRS